MIRLGTVADDLTGATTAAALLARNGISAIACWNIEAARKAIPSDAEAVLLSTGSRAMKPEDAYAVVRSATEILHDLGATYFQKRIDTTMRGGIGAEIDAMLDVLGEEYLAVVVPSMPQNHRIVVGGYSLIDGELLERTEVRHDTRTPVNKSFIPRLLAAQTRRPVKQLTAECLMEGKDAVAARLQTLYQSGIRIVVADAVLMEDIVLIASACCQTGLPVLSVDPGSFTASLLGERHPVKHDTIMPEAPARSGSVLLAVGSTTQISRRQIDVLCESEKNVRILLRTEHFLRSAEEREAEIERAAAEVLRLLRLDPLPHAIILDASTETARFNDADEAMRDEMREREDKDPVGDSLGLILRRVLDQPEHDKVCGLYMTGGDTMAAILTHLDGNSIRVHDYIVPQVDLCRLSGGPSDGMIIVSKGGLVGDDQTAVRIVDKIRQEAARQGLAFNHEHQE